MAITLQDNGPLYYPPICEDLHTVMGPLSETYGPLSDPASFCAGAQS